MKRKGEVMKKTSLGRIYRPSENIVARDIQGDLIIVPIVSGISDMEEEVFTLNETGRAVWDQCNGKRTLREIVEALGKDFEGNAGEIEKDVLGIVQELVRRKMLVAVG